MMGGWQEMDDGQGIHEKLSDEDEIDIDMGHTRLITS